MDQIVAILQWIVTVLQWIIDHWSDILKVILTIIGAASAIIRFLPTLKSTNPLLPVIKFVGSYIALNRSGERDAEVRKVIDKIE